jgi:small subunit ribosomal protein S20
MANIKSAQRQAKKNKKRRQINLARKTAIKTVIKKLNAAVEQNADQKQTQTLLKEATAQIARAKNKGVLHKRTAARKMSRLAKRVAVAQK